LMDYMLHTYIINHYCSETSNWCGCCWNTIYQGTCH